MNDDSVSSEGVPYPVQKSQPMTGLDAIDGTAKNQDAVRLGRQTMGADDQRWLRYRSRIKAALAGLQKDMDLWSKAIADDGSTRVLRHHVEQFRNFTTDAYRLLLGEDMVDSTARQTVEFHPLSPQEADREDFREMVAGVFTGQWLLLRNVIVQRVAGSPYRGEDENSGIQALDADARRYYQSLYKVLNAKLGDSNNLLNWRYRNRPLVRFAPLVHLGTGIQLAVFNRRTPLIISVPVGALPDMPSSAMTRMAIPHEVAHAVFVQVPELIEEMERKARERLDAKAPPRQRRVLYDMVLNWMEEICADLVGTALAGEPFAESARWIMAGPDLALGVTSRTHPPAIMRPVIHFLALARIEQNVEAPLFEALRKEVSASGIDTNLLARQFRALPALMYVDLGTVYDALVDVVRDLLDTELTILGGVTLGALLAEIYRTHREAAHDSEVSSEELESWGKISDLEAKEFVIDMPSSPVTPAYVTPGVSIHPFCWTWLVGTLIKCPEES